MNFSETPIKGLRILEPSFFEDIRGSFIKTYTEDFFHINGLNITIKESYYSISHKNVIRGMHFQTPPHDHIKIVYVPYGRVIDVVLDIRKNSPTYGNFFTIELSAKNRKIIIIPKGLAHGFKSLENATNVSYMQTSCYAPTYDYGIHYDSFGFDWDTLNPQLSNRDLSFPTLDTFQSPFMVNEK